MTGLVLAGGQSRRMGQDKGLMHWRDRPMAHWVAEALSTVATPLLISANRSLPAYRQLGQVLQDTPEFKGQGPLAGLLAGLIEARQRGFDAVLVSPCDTPGIEPSVFQRLLTAWCEQPTPTAASRPA